MDAAAAGPPGSTGLGPRAPESVIAPSARAAVPGYLGGRGRPPGRPGGEGTRDAVLFYGGDFDGRAGLDNESNTVVPDARVYDDFQINSGSYQVSGLFSRDLSNIPAVTHANWQIREGVAPGNGGTLIASGQNVPATDTPTGFSGFGYQEHQYTVTVAPLVLPPGHYWINVQPIGPGPGCNCRSLQSTTSGANGQGQPLHNGLSYIDSTSLGFSWADTQSALGPGVWDFSGGVIGTAQGAPAAPPALVPACDTSCGCARPPAELVTTAPGLCGSGGVSAFSSQPVRYFDGTVKLTTADLESDGFGVPWGQTRSWTNGPGYAAGSVNGFGTVVSQMPSLVQVSGDATVALVTNGTTARYFDVNGNAYVPRFFVQDQLGHNAAAHEFTLTDTTGSRITLNDFDAVVLPQARGQLKSFADRDGNLTRVVSRTSDGKIQEVQRTDPASGVTESYLYAYLPGGDPNAGLLSSVILRREPAGGSFGTVRQVDYAYYTGSEPPGLDHGNQGDLKTATIRDGAGAALDVKYYRYYKPGDADGYAHGLKYAFEPASFARLAAAFADPFSATDAQVQAYADTYFRFDAQQRVTLETAQGAGCSSCTGGQGTFTYAYASSANADGFNSWKVRTVETLPDGNENIVYTNAYGEAMLKAFHDSGSNLSWDTFYRYDGQGRLDLVASPSAVAGYSDAYADLLHQQGGNYQYLNDTSGLVHVIDYYATTTAGEQTPGGAAGYVQDEKLQRGELGGPAVQRAVQYFAHAGGGATVFPVAATTAYRNADGSGAQTTGYAYTWYAGTAQVQSRAVTLPAVSAAQNGPGTPDVDTATFDVFGRVVQDQDGDGFVRTAAYDNPTGAAVQLVTDVGGLHLVTQREVDALGRVTRLTDPNGDVTYVVYNDLGHELQVYPGWDAAAEAPTGPTQLFREDRAHSPSYTEELTMAAAPHVSGGRPDGTEPVGGVQTLSRVFTSPGGQVVESDAYFSLQGLTYSTDPYLGAAGNAQPDGTVTGNYWPRSYAYDARGRPSRVQAPTGTIAFVVYDGLDRVVSTWVGTADANLVQVDANEYDSGGVGDGNLTQATQFPGGTAAPRVTQTFFDWRDRPVASKSGVQGGEDTATHRPITYTEYDNLDESVAQELYDGDGVPIGDANNDGVPDKPPAGRLRARSTSAYDDQGRVFRTQVYSVDQSTGAVSSDSLTANNFYDRRGDLIEQAEPGGTVAKYRYDGAARRTVTYATDGGSGTDWNAANTVAGDVVLGQAETAYDSNGNAVLATTRQRFHDATATGALADPNTDPKARVSYAPAYFDAADRRTADVDVGTNGGTAYARPPAVPPRSETVLVTSYAYNAAGWVQDTTDPRGVDARTLYDALGRTASTVAAYTDGTPTASANLTTAYTYDGDGNVLRQAATDVQPGGSLTTQVTQYVYAASTAAGSLVSSHDLLTEVRYPDKATGLPSATDRERYTYNAVGQARTYLDRNGIEHRYTYDVVGRPTADAVPGLRATPVSGIRLGPQTLDRVLRLETAYDTGGRPYLFTSYDATNGGQVLNQVEQVYTGLGQLTAEYQAHGGAVNTSTTPKVQYAYSEMAGGTNHSRLVSTTYPNGREVMDNYATGLDDRISRLSALSDGSGTLEAYSYLGLGTVVQRARPQPGFDLTYIKQAGELNGDAGDPYTGLDRFGRVVDQRWLKPTDGNNPTDRFQYGYDRDGNPLYRDNLTPQGNGFDELYHANGVADTFDGQGNLVAGAYDRLNRLPSFERGTLNASKDSILSPSHSQGWDLDALGNWASVTTDGTPQNRTHNQENEITSITNQPTPTYDADGNTTQDETGQTYAYDAWNRLVQVKSAGGAVIASYAYDALGRRIAENEGTAKDLYYSSDWQVLEEQVGGLTQAQYVWSPVYVDALVERDQGGQRVYVQQDANWDVTAVVDTTGTVQERYAYDPYGKPSVLAPDFSPRGSSLFGWVYLHQGGRFDTTTGLFNFRHRDYSPTLGRWMETDPLGYVDGANRYAYARSDPLMNEDPAGLDDKRFDFQDPNKVRWTPYRVGKAIGVTLVTKLEVHCQCTCCIVGYIRPPYGGDPGIGLAARRIDCTVKLELYILINPNQGIPLGHTGEAIAAQKVLAYVYEHEKQHVKSIQNSVKDALGPDLAKLSECDKSEDDCKKLAQLEKALKDKAVAAILKVGLGHGGKGQPEASSLPEPDPGTDVNGNKDDKLPPEIQEDKGRLKPPPGLDKVWEKAVKGDEELG
jgi:RHS repeat-associated protein